MQQPADQGGQGDGNMPALAQTSMPAPTPVEDDEYEEEMEDGE